MKINGIVNFNYSNNLNVRNNNLIKPQKYNENVCENKFASIAMPYTNQYLAQYNPQALAFLGGYSINLAETNENLSDEVYPPGIKEMIEKTLSEGNPEDKTLIDIHREKYGKLNQMKSLDEVKAVFPEFKDVLSDSEVEYNSSSFIYQVKNGEHEWFDEKADVALQLLQMYWADGFSLNALKEYTDDKNINNVFNKLNIPKFKRQYASVLKLSDTKYNEEFTTKMSGILKGIPKKRNEQEDDDETREYIPRGPMSEAQKKKISESLIKHYAKHPEKIAQMSERMKKYYAEHPEEHEKLANVVNIAWGLREAKSIRKALSKFLKKKDVTPEEFAKLNLSKDENEKKTLKNFWDRNVWAKKQWSVCMTKGWEIYKKKQEEEEDKKHIVPITVYPPSLIQDMRDWFRRNGYDPNRITDYKAYVRDDDKELPKADKYSNDALNAYFAATDVNLKADLCRTTLFKTLSDVMCSKNLDDFTRYKIVLSLAEDLKFEPYSGSFEEMSEEEAVDIYAKFYFSSVQEGREDVVKMLDENLEKSYRYIKSHNMTMANKIKTKAIKAVRILMGEEILKGTMLALKEKNKAKDYTAVPPGMKKEIINSIKQAGIGVMSSEEFEKRITDDDIQTLMNSHLQGNDKLKSNLENSCQLSMLKTVLELLNEAEDENFPREKRDTILAIRDFFYHYNFDLDDHIMTISLKNLSLCYANIINFAKVMDYPDIVQRFEDNYDYIYTVIETLGANAAIDKLFNKTDKKSE